MLQVPWIFWTSPLDFCYLLAQVQVQVVVPKNVADLSNARNF